MKKDSRIDFETFWIQKEHEEKRSHSHEEHMHKKEFNQA
jgi:hypothetical protein